MELNGVEIAADPKSFWIQTKLITPTLMLSMIKLGKKKLLR